MVGRRRLSVTASLLTSSGALPAAQDRGPRAAPTTIEASRREARRLAPIPSGRTARGRLARHRAIAESRRGAG